MTTGSFAEGRGGPTLTTAHPITILEVPIDERGERGLPLAAWLAGCWDIPVRLLHVVGPDAAPAVDLAEAAAAMTRRWPEIAVETMQVAGAEVAAAVTGAVGPDSLLIVSTDNANAWSFKNSVAERLCNQAPGPVVLLGPEARSLAPGGDVVVAHDGRPGSEALLAAGVALTAALGRNLWLVQVVAETAGAEPELHPEVGVALQARIDGIDPALDPRWEVIHSNDPVRALEGFADRIGASFLVAGSRGRDDTSRTTMSSIAMGLVANAGRPVLVVAH